MVCSDKKTYASRHIAKMAAKKLKAAGKGNVTGLRSRKLRAYACNKCGWYHLSSHEGERY